MAATTKKTTTKKSTSKKAASARKPATKKATKAAKSTVAKNVGRGKDDARKVASASEGDLNPSQVRMLRFLLGRKNPASMAQLKDGVGIGAENKYSATWLSALHELRDYDYVREEKFPNETTGRTGNHYSIRPEGKKALTSSEKAASKVE